MAEYTSILENDAINIDTEDELFTKTLETCMDKFCEWDESLIRFLESKGMEINEDENYIINYIYNAFKRNDIAIDKRTIKSWISEHKRITNKTAIKLCFALNLNLKESDDFFRRVCLTNGLYCHDVEGLVAYFCIKNKLPYYEVENILKEIELNAKNSSDDSEEEVIYTKNVKKISDSFNTKNELMDYIIKNYNWFNCKYTNARKLYLYFENTICESFKEKLSTDELLLKVLKYTYVDRVESDLVKDVDGDLIHGKTDLINDRSIKTIFKNNKLIHTLAQDNFPEKDIINKFRRGDKVEAESVRKILILFGFIEYCISDVEKNNWSEKETFERGIEKINMYLVESGFQMLYPGNPYDWIFLHVLNQSEPRKYFGEYMNELYLYYQDNN